MSKISERLNTLAFLIPNENLRHIIFNYEDEDSLFLTDDKDCLKYLQNIMTFTSLVVLRAFHKWKKENLKTSETEFSNSMLRIYNMLNRAYAPNKMVGDFVDNLIINLVIDHSLNQNEVQSFTQTIGIWNLFSFPQTNNNLSKYIYMLKQSRISSKYKSTFSFENLCECIEMFTYLRLSEAELLPFGSDDSQLYSVNLNIARKSVLELGYSALVAQYGATKKSYYMFDYDFEDVSPSDEIEKKHQEIKLDYNCLDNEDSFTVTLLNSDEASFAITDDGNGYVYKDGAIVESFVVDYDVTLTVEDEESSLFFKDYFLINNKYIRELSLAVSDALLPKTKEQIVTHLTKYRSIFDNMKIVSLYGKSEVLGRRWDEIVMFLMLDRGIYEFLKFLLHRQEYSTFITAFYNRFGKDRVKEICETDSFLKDPERKVRYIPSKEGKLDYLANALIALAKKLLSPDSINLTKNAFPMGIDDVMEEVERIFKSTKHTEEDKIFCLTNSTIVAISFLTTFYSGVIKYATSKKNALLSFEDNGDRLNPGSDGYIRAQEGWIKEFKNSVVKSRADFGNESDAPRVNVRSKAEAAKWINHVFKSLIEINKRLSVRGSAEAEVFANVIGRRSLFNRNIMSSYREEIIKAVNEGSAYTLYTKVRGLLNYLKTGVDNYDNNSYRIENAIYPVVGQYFSTETSRDGYKCSYFKVDTYRSEIRNSITIKMITNDTFDFGQCYYCVPNNNKVADINEDGNKAKQTWIDPIIIPCSIFQSVINTEVEPLKNEDDFKGAIELIYESDPYIYGNLFGSLENAKKVFPELLNTKNCKFHKSHYLIIKDKGEVIAIASMYKSDTCVWDKDTILKAFGSAGVEPPDSFRSAVKHIEDLFNESIGDDFNMIDDVCVRPEYRNNGIGRSLIWYMIKEAERAGISLVLSTYAENGIARSLYARLGFIPYSKNTSTSSGGKDYFRMIRI